MFNLQLLKFEPEFGTSECRNLGTSDHWKYERRSFDRWKYERRSLWSLIAGRLNVYLNFVPLNPAPEALHLHHSEPKIYNSNPWKLQNSNLWICLCLVNAIQTHTL